MGMNCEMCGFDHRTVKLVTMQVMEGKEPKTITVCEECKPRFVAHNHPENQNLGAPDNGAPGFVKPSNPNDYPPVRPS